MKNASLKPDKLHLVVVFVFSIHLSNYGQVWNQFVNAKSNGTEPILPDYSYAGYEYGESPVPTVTHQVFDVTSYGAVANDNISDEPAIRAAIAAAEANGSGIVFFPPGVFRVNTDTDDPTSSIRIRKSNIVLRGSGINATQILMENKMTPTNPNANGSTPFKFTITPLEKNITTVANITADADRETFSVTVDNTTGLSVGQNIILSLNTNDNNAKNFFTGRVPSARLFFSEFHEIEAINGNTIQLREPIHVHGIRSLDGWVVKTYNSLNEVGVEDIHFKGSWAKNFSHHRNPEHDGAFSGIRFGYTTNSWMRRCRFTDWNFIAVVNDSRAFSALDIKGDGKKAHYSLKSTRSYGVFFGKVNMSVNHLHNGSVQNAIGTVFWRWKIPAVSGWDCHTDYNTATLMDKWEGGFKSNSGGTTDRGPRHIRGLTFWNYKHTGGQRGQNLSEFFEPNVIGIFGKPMNLNISQLAVSESLGSTTTPESLFEAQLELRLGQLPQWLIDLKNGNNPPPSGDTIIYQAEDLVRSAGGAGTVLNPAGTWVNLIANSTGDWVEFTLPNVPTGTYNMEVNIVRFANGGRAQTSVVNVNQGNVIDFYNSSNSPDPFPLGTRTFTSSGNKKVRFTVTGKNSGSSGFKIGIDHIVLTRTATNLRTSLVKAPGEPDTEFYLNLYPNPAKEYLKLNMFMETGVEVNFNVYNLSGKTVLKHKRKLIKGANKVGVNVSTLSQGTYILHVIGGKSTYSELFIVE